MKGTFFQKPLEFALVITGESWKQGEAISGSLVAKNHSNEEVSLENIGVQLAYGDHKKIKGRKDKAFLISQKELFTEASLDAAGEKTLEWSFQLPSDCEISTKAGTYYLLCGNEDTPFEGGLMELAIEPLVVIKNFLELFENFYRFKVKEIKNKKGLLEVKMEAPKSKQFGAIDKLMLEMNMKEDALVLKYIFTAQRLSYESGMVQAKAVQLEFDQVLEKKEHTLYKESPNQDVILKALLSILEQVKSKTLM
jgi:hypothetical protein